MQTPGVFANAGKKCLPWGSMLLAVVLASILGCSDGSDTHTPNVSEAPPPVEPMLIADLMFTDANLAVCVSNTAAKFGWITIEEVTALTCQNDFASAGPIFTLAGMEALSEASPPALTHLDLKFNEIQDASPLRDLTSLTSLELGGWTN